MSNAYVNQLLFGHTNRSITKEYVDGLLPNMLTVEWMAKHNATVISQVKTQSSLEEEEEARTIPEYTSFGLQKQPVKNSSAAHNVKDSISQAISTMKPDKHRTNTRGIAGTTLFWAIYSAEHPKEAFLRPSAQNVEIETRMRIVDELKKTPKRLKETSAKLTIEQTQGLFGAMLTAREDRLDFCVAYSVYYNKHILVVYPKTYRLFSPTSDSTIEDDDHVIILSASCRSGKTTYSFNPENGKCKSTADEIMRTHLPPLRAQSHYKTAELESMAVKIGISTTTSTVLCEGKRRKKEEIYNDIRVAIHNDMEFVQGQSWNKN